MNLPAPGGAGAGEWESFLARGDGVPDAEVRRRIERIGPDDPSDVIFTSGTTGTPKGVVLRHGASLLAYEAYNRGYGIGEGDRALIALPLLPHLRLQGRMDARPDVRGHHHPRAGLRPGGGHAGDRGRAGHPHARGAHHVPGRPRPSTRASFDLSSLVAVTVAASTVPWSSSTGSCASRGSRPAGRLRDDPPHGIIIHDAAGRRAQLSTSTVATPIPGVGPLVVDHQRQAWSRASTGELLVRGYNLMSGYYAGTQATEVGVDLDGCAQDRGHRGGGRRRLSAHHRPQEDLFIMGGFNVAPAEVEKALAGFDKIAQVAVIGVPDDRFGEVGMAFVIPRAGVDLTPEEVVATPGSTSPLVPRRFEFVESFRCNATGKVLKNDLRSLALRTGG